MANLPGGGQGGTPTSSRAGPHAVRAITWIGAWGVLVGLALAMLVAGAAAGRGAPGAIARGGYLDLSAWNPAAQGPVALDGEWEFYWSRLLEPVDFAAGSAPSPTGWFRVPSAWNGYRVGDRRLGGDGYATLRLRLRLPPEPGTLALYVPYASTAYRLWVNDRPVAANGVVGTSRETSRPHDRMTVAVYEPVSPDMELVLQVSNFSHRVGGLWRSILLGRSSDIDAISRRRLARDVALMAAYGVIGIYHLSMWVLRRAERSPLYFGLLCIGFALGVGLTGDMVITQLVAPELNWEVELRAGYLVITTGLALVVLFLHSLYPHEIGRRLARAGTMLPGAFTALVMVTPARVYTRWLVPYQVGVSVLLVWLTAGMVRALRRRRQGAELFVAGMAIALVSAGHDMARWTAQATHLELLPFALLVWVLLQAFGLSGRSAEAYHRLERLAGENARLLDTVRRQIEQLRRTRRMVAAAEDARHRSLAEFLHGRVQNRLLVAWYRLGECLQALPHDPSRAATLVDEVRSTIDHIREHDVRQVSHLLHPSIVRVGLLPAVRSLLEQFEGPCSARLDVDAAVVSLDDPAHSGIPESIRLAVYRMVEEGLNNVRRHAGASAVIVTLRAAPPQGDGQTGWLWVEVADDGRGFDPQQVADGAGLAMAADRVVQAGGTWRVESQPGQGTRLRARFALPTMDAPGNSQEISGQSSARANS